MTAPNLTPTEAAKVAAFGLDRPPRHKRILTFAEGLVWGIGEADVEDE